jgi:hypothetical protein
MTAGSFFENAQGSIDVMGLVNRFTGGGSSTPKPAAPQAQPQPQPQATQPPAALPQGPVKAPDPGAGR